jgi:hypothetical protein
MSTHLLIAAMYLDGLPQGRKLVLAAIADSGDEHTLESAPGLPKMRAWSGLSKSAVLDNVKALEDAGLITRLEAGRLGRRAVYQVFPAGVPAIPHPSDVAARYPSSGSGEQDPPVIPNVGDNPARQGPASRTLGSGSTPSRVLPAGPLHAYPSVSSAQRPTEPVETGRSASGFPGSRATSAEAREEAQGIARRARGANDQPCPIHPAMIVPCGRCANAAADAKTRKAAAAEARRLIREARTAPVAPPTDTEERSAS